MEGHLPVRMVLLLFSCAACEKAEKPMVRTEPWPAHAVPASASATLGKPGRPREYSVDRGSIRIDLIGRSGRTRASIDRLVGQLRFDPARPEQSTGEVKADLFSLKLLDPKSGEEDPSLTLRALWALELGNARPMEQRERERFAEFRVTEIEELEPHRAGAAPPSQFSVQAIAELTLHRFRVPLRAHFEVRPIEGAPNMAAAIKVRTARPLVIALFAHAIVPRGPDGLEISGADLPAPPREARVSAEILFRSRPIGATATAEP